MEGLNNVYKSVSEANQKLDDAYEDFLDVASSNMICRSLEQKITYTFEDLDNVPQLKQLLEYLINKVEKLEGDNNE